MTNKSTYQHSFEVQEIIGKTPGWMIRWGITALFTTLLMLLLSSAFISYPVVATPEIKLALSAPLFYIERQAGETLTFQKEEGVVTAHAVIAIVADASGNSRHVLSPYAGTMKRLGSFGGKGRENAVDTLAVIIPEKVHYQFRGSLPAVYARQQVKGTTVNVVIAKNQISGERVVLKGVIQDVSPIAVGGACPFWGDLDTGSDTKLAQAAILTDTCEGIIELPISQLSILKRIISGAII